MVRCLVGTGEYDLIYRCDYKSRVLAGTIRNDQFFCHAEIM